MKRGNDPNSGTMGLSYLPRIISDMVTKVDSPVRGDLRILGSGKTPRKTSVTPPQASENIGVSYDKFIPKVSWKMGFGKY